MFFSFNACINSFQLLACFKWLSRAYFALSNMSLCILFKTVAIYSLSFSWFNWNFSPLWRMATLTSPFSISFDPISSLIGVPLTSQFANLNPGLWFSLSSTWTLIPAAFSYLASSQARPTIALLSSFLKRIGMITTYTWATLGGSTTPVLSEWIMIIEPIERVESPHEVYQTNDFCLFSSSNHTSNILLKFWPSMWLVAP